MRVALSCGISVADPNCNSKRVPEREHPPLRTNYTATQPNQQHQQTRQRSKEKKTTFSSHDKGHRTSQTPRPRLQKTDLILATGKDKQVPPGHSSVLDVLQWIWTRGEQRGEGSFALFYTVAPEGEMEPGFSTITSTRAETIHPTVIHSSWEKVWIIHVFLRMEKVKETQDWQFSQT